MHPTPEDRRLAKFLFASAAFFFVGTVHGVVQVIHPVRVWLDSIGSPYGGPGHMIDPLAHAHINVVGGVVVFIMGAVYYLLPRMIGVAVFSTRLIQHTFWWTVLGVCGFYSTLMVFGIWEGYLLLNDPGRMDAVHEYYKPLIAIVSTVMGMGFWIFFFNVFATFWQARKHRGDST